MSEKKVKVVEEIQPVGGLLSLQYSGPYESKTSGGLYLPSTADYIHEFVVRAVGGKVNELLGDVIVPGDHVLVHKDMATQTTVGGICLVPAGNIYAIVRRPPEEKK